MKKVEDKTQDEKKQDQLDEMVRKMEDVPPPVEKLYMDFLTKGTVDKETYQQCNREHKKYITPDIKLAYKWMGIPDSIKEEFDKKVKKMKEELFEGVVYPAEGNNEYMANPEKYKDFDEANKRYATRSKALFNKTYRKFGVRMDKKFNIRLLK